MQMEIRTKHGHLDSDLKEKLERRLCFALARFGGRIRRISAFLEDINGPRGGEDQHCKIEVSLVPSGLILAEATSSEITLALGRAADRVARRVRDALDRKRTARPKKIMPPSEIDAPPQAL